MDRSPKALKRLRENMWGRGSRTTCVLLLPGPGGASRAYLWVTRQHRFDRGSGLRVPHTTHCCFHSTLRSKSTCKWVNSHASWSSCGEVWGKLGRPTGHEVMGKNLRMNERVKCKLYTRERPSGFLVNVLIYLPWQELYPRRYSVLCSGPG